MERHPFIVTMRAYLDGIPSRPRLLPGPKLTSKEETASLEG